MSYEVKEIISLAKKNREKYENLSPKELYDLMESSIQAYNNEATKDDVKKEKFTDAILANYFLQTSEDLEAPPYRTQSKEIFSQLDVDKEDLYEIDNALNDVYFKEKEINENFDTMTKNVGKMSKDFKKYQKEYKYISYYAEALIASNKDTKKDFLKNIDEGSSQLNEMGRINSMCLQDYLGLYPMVRKNLENRSRLNRFFHPFQTKKEKEVLKTLEDTFAKNGISKEDIDLMYETLDKKYDVNLNGITPKEGSNVKNNALDNTIEEKIPNIDNDVKEINDDAPMSEFVNPSIQTPEVHKESHK